MNTLSWIHLGAGAAAMLLGLAILFLRKGTKNHRTLGWIYVSLLVTALVAILLKTRTHPAPFAGYTVFLLLALVAAITSARARSSVHAWRGWHAGLMLLTLLGSVMAASSIGAGALVGAVAGAAFYQMFNVIIITFTALALWFIWHSHTVWGVSPGKIELSARRQYAIVVAVSSLVLVIAQWPLAFG